jgi:putative transposase
MEWQAFRYIRCWLLYFTIDSKFVIIVCMNNRFIRKTNRIPLSELYQKNNWYFVTICTHQRQNLLVEEPLRFHCEKKFQTPKNDVGEHLQSQVPKINFVEEPLRFHLSDMGIEIENLWYKLPELFSGIILDEFVIMPNHVHFVIGFGEKVFYKNGFKNQSLSDFVSKFKSISWTNIKNNVWGSKIIETKIEPMEQPMEPQGFLYGENNSRQIWQKSFYDHIIRDEDDLEHIRQYICDNTSQWELDTLNPNIENK